MERYDLGLPDSDGYVVGSVLRQSGHSHRGLRDES
jgi:hypothetical protein